LAQGAWLWLPAAWTDVRTLAPCLNTPVGAEIPGEFMQREENGSLFHLRVLGWRPRL